MPHPGQQKPRIASTVVSHFDGFGIRIRHYRNPRCPACTSCTMAWGPAFEASSTPVSQLPRSRSTETRTCINPGTKTGHSRLSLRYGTVGWAGANCSPNYSSLRHEPDKHARPCRVLAHSKRLHLRAYYFAARARLRVLHSQHLQDSYSFWEQTLIKREHLLFL